jgi:uncharacterized protein with HEPN domain
MLDAANRITRFMSGRCMADLHCDDMLGLAVVKSLEVIGEAAGKVGDVTQAQLPALDWRGMKWLRNRTVHGYDTVNFEIIWKTTQEDVPALRKVLEEALAGVGPKAEGA